MSIFETRSHIVPLVAALLAVGTVVSTAQRTTPRSFTMDRSTDFLKANVRYLPMKVATEVPTEELTAPVTSPVLTGRMPKVVDAIQAEMPGTKVGYTYYDFQTNGAMANRLAYYADGGDKYIQMLWMTSKDSTRDAATNIPGFAGTARGTHYTYLLVTNPDAPELGVEEWAKVESQRAGWPSIAVYTDGVIGTPSHTPIRFYGNAGVGDQPTFYAEVTAPADSALWPRAAVDGDGTTHLIYNRTIPGREALYVNDVCHRRSTDGGFSWSSETVFSGPNSAIPNMLGGLGGDTYAVAAQGKKVAVLYTDRLWRAYLWTSYDGGATWPADSARVAFIPQNTFIDSATNEWGSFERYSDTMPGPNGHLDVIIDKNGVTHYVIGLTGSYLTRRDTMGQSVNVIGQVTTEEGLRTYGMVYGNDASNEMVYMAPPAGGEWDGEGVPLNLRAFDGSSRWPQLGLDADNNLYLTYGSWKNGDIKQVVADTTPQWTNNEPDTLNTVDALVGHIWATYKPNGFNIWSQPVDITPEGVNCQYASLCDEVVNGRMYIGYSASADPGDRVTNTEMPATPADVYMMAYDVANLGTVNSTETEDELKADVRIMPNPARDHAMLRIATVTPGTVTVSLHTTLGETIMTSTSPDPRSDWELMIDTRNLAAGTYHCIIEQGGARTTVPLVVVR